MNMIRPHIATMTNMSESCGQDDSATTSKMSGGLTTPKMAPKLSTTKMGGPPRVALADCTGIVFFGVCHQLAGFPTPMGASRNVREDFLGRGIGA